MMRSKITHLFIAGLILSIGAAPSSVWSAEAAAPKRSEAIKQAIEKDPESGKILVLDGTDPPSWGIFLPETTGAPQGVVLIVHDLAGHPDWPEVIAPLRKNLPHAGWSTFAVLQPRLAEQVPPLAADDLIKTTHNVLDASVALLQKQGIANIALLGYGTGAILCAEYAATAANSAITALLMVSMPVDKQEPKLYGPSYLEKMPVPMLDVFGTRDGESVSGTAALRADAAHRSGAAAIKTQSLDRLKQSGTAESAQIKNTGYVAYRQIPIAGADRGFSGYTDLLTKRIVGWLRRHAAGTQIKR